MSTTQHQPERNHHDHQHHAAELNGVDTATLFATLDAVRDQPELARFQFRTTTGGSAAPTTAPRSTASTAPAPSRPVRRSFTIDADHPAVLVGEDHAPTPAEHLLQALGGCLTSGLANIAAARGIELGEVTARVEGDIDLLGILGLDDERPQRLRGDPGHLPRRRRRRGRAAARLVEQARGRSAVYDVLTNGVPVTVDVATA